MVSKRQKLARKKFKEANPGLFPKSEPTPPMNPESKNRKKKNKLKAKRQDKVKDGGGVRKGPKKPSSRKHPLRVPGMKPGESCYICKAQDHIAKLCPEKAQWEKNKICLNCRNRGHSLKNCPNKTADIEDTKLCYNCGKAGHSLFKCPEPLQEGGTKFASCFICNERGHLSKNCPKNTHGIYPKGGSCKICGGVTHLAKDCPNKRNLLSHANLASDAAGGVGSIRAANEYEGKSRVTKLTSGDDLDDDFMVEDMNNGNVISSSDSVGVQIEKNNVVVKPKKQGPKVVNFLG